MTKFSKSNQGHLDSARDGAEIEDKNGSSPAMSSSLVRKLLSGRKEAAKQGLSAVSARNIEIEERKQANKTLFHSVGASDMRAIQKALALGADIDAKHEEGGYTAAMSAAVIGREAPLRLLIDAKADLNVQTDAGFTAVMGAASWGREACLRLLIAGGADINAKDNEGRTAAMLAADNGCGTCLRLLMDANVGLAANAKEGSIAAPKESPAMVALIASIVLARKEAAELRRAVESPIMICGWR